MGMEKENMGERGRTGKSLLTEFTINVVSLVYLILRHFCHLEKVCTCVCSLSQYLKCISYI